MLFVGFVAYFVLTISMTQWRKRIRRDMNIKVRGCICSVCQEGRESTLKASDVVKMIICCYRRSGCVSGHASTLLCHVFVHLGSGQLQDNEANEKAVESLTNFGTAA